MGYELKEINLESAPPEVLDHARRVVAGNARDVEDARELLEALGLA